MAQEKQQLSKAKMLAALIAGTGNQSHAMASVQRSHRFPLHLFVQMENLAKHANVPLSLIINELIECGLDALQQELPEEVTREMTIATKEQMNRPTVTERLDSKEYRAKGRTKRRLRSV